MAALFPRGPEQERIARASLAAIAEGSRKDVSTAVLPFDGFTLAEDYHQKYWLRRFTAATREIEAVYPQLSDFVRSTVATRLNALVGGGGTRAEFERLAPETGLSEEALGELRKALR